MQPVIVKKYSNNKLYIPRGNTENPGYIRVKDLVGILRKGKDVKVIDNDSGEDITLSVLKPALQEVEVPLEVVVGLLRGNS